MATSTLSGELQNTPRDASLVPCSVNGFKPSIRRQKYQLQPYDLVTYNNSTYRVKGVHCYGKRVVLENSKGKNPSVAITKVELVKYGKGLLFTLC